MADRFYRRAEAHEVNRLLDEGWRIAGASTFALDDVSVLLFRDGSVDAYWFEQWIKTWREIGWLASTDILQTQLTIAVTSIARSTSEAIRQLQMTTDNIRISLDWVLKTARNR